MAMSAMLARKRLSRPKARLKTMAKAAIMEITVEMITDTPVATRELRIHVSTGHCENTAVKLPIVGCRGRPVGFKV